jgi:hypothetical protein
VSQSICYPAIQILEIVVALLYAAFVMTPTAHQDVSLEMPRSRTPHLQSVYGSRVNALSNVGSLRGVSATRKIVVLVHSRHLQRQNGNLWVGRERSMPSKVWYGHTVLKLARLSPAPDQNPRGAMDHRCCVLTLTFRDRHLVQDRS